MSKRRTRAVVGLGIVAILAASITGCASNPLTVPTAPWTQGFEDVGTARTLAGIEVSDSEACPWIGDHVVVVFSTDDVSVDRDGPTLNLPDGTVAVGDRFTFGGHAQELADGFDCGGQHWDRAVLLPSEPSAGD